ncbi:hypothetical protein QJS10_CPB15g00867 [Acorus calamus]|uniref:Uncharacterized protein n=1 Tax=Acorus calamus TaxID=4465 RepID=A0AAV9D4S3_ACOCL|nr:hypothetical protein QJS10_CPB15g00867 [Acorus calamus]
MTRSKAIVSRGKRPRVARGERSPSSSSSESDRPEVEAVGEDTGTTEVPPADIGMGDVGDLPSGAVPEVGGSMIGYTRKRRRGDQPVAVEGVVSGVGGPIEGATEGEGSRELARREATEARAEEEESRAMGAFAKFISGAGRVEGTGEARDEAGEAEGMGTGAAEAGVGAEAEEAMKADYEILL